MAAVATELVDSREWSGGSVIQHWVVTGTADSAAARTALLAATATTYNGLVREADPTVTPVWVDTVAVNGHFDCSVRYNPAAGRSDTPPPIGQLRIRGTTRGGTEHIIVAKDTITFAPAAGASVDDFGDLIGASGNTADADVAGVDIGVRQFTFTVNKVFAGGALPTLANLYALTYTTNSTAWRFTDTVTGHTIDLAIGEGLFTGADFGEVRGDGGMEISYEFIKSSNATPLVVGPAALGLSLNKAGHDYLWVRYEAEPIPGLKIIGQIPKAAYTCKVYDAAAWTNLLVGVAV